MQIIKSLLLAAAGLCITVTLTAQQASQTVKSLPAESTKAPAPDSKSAVLPVTKQIATEAAPAVPSPNTSNENNSKIPGNEHIALKIVDANTPTNQLTSEQIKTLNGTASLPKQSAIAPGTQNSKPTQLSKPVLVKEQ